MLLDAFTTLKMKRIIIKLKTFHKLYGFSFLFSSSWCCFFSFFFVVVFTWCVCVCVSVLTLISHVSIGVVCGVDDANNKLRDLFRSRRYYLFFFVYFEQTNKQYDIYVSINKMQFTVTAMNEIEILFEFLTVAFVFAIVCKFVF